MHFEHLKTYEGCFRKKGVGGGGVEWNLNILSVFYGTVHTDIPGNTPTHRILIDFSSTPDAVFPGTAQSSYKIDNNNFFS